MKAPSLLVIVAVVTGVAFAQDQAPPPAASDVNPLVLTVNGDPVYAAEISLVMKTIAKNVQAQGQEPLPKEVLGAATQRVIEQKLLAQEARRFGLNPDESQVQAMVTAAARQMGGRDQLAAWLARGGSSVEQLTKIYREVDLGRILIAKQIRPTVQVAESEEDELISKHPELFKVEQEGEAAKAMSPEAARQRAHVLLINQKTAKLVSDLLKTLYDAASIEYPEQPAETTPGTPSPNLAPPPPPDGTPSP